MYRFFLVCYIDHATEDDLKAFVYEMDVLASIEEHPNIVSLVRVCSVGSELIECMGSKGHAGTMYLCIEVEYMVLTFPLGLK